MTILQETIKFANTLVQNLSWWGSRGMEEQGYVATVFISSIAETGEISSRELAYYINALEELQRETNWFKKDDEAKAEAFLDAVSNYLYAKHFQFTNSDAYLVEKMTKATSIKM